jgi:hypothetical protein
MKKNYLLFLLMPFMIGFHLKVQAQKADSAKVANTLHELLRICRSVDFTNPNVTQTGIFYKAAPYVVYRGEDKKRAWKSMANYKNEQEKNGVDKVCERINRTVNQDSAGYKITGYKTEKESEGVWHVLMVSYRVKDIEKKAVFAFLKIGNQFGLGDID